MKTNTCTGCKYCMLSVPVCLCKHKDNYMCAISDTMMFKDAGKTCPLNKPDYRMRKIENVSEIISDLGNTCNKLGIRGAVIGISGGKDSTIVAKLMTEILGKDNVVGVLMPNGIQKDISDSQRVVDILGIRSITINIGNSFENLYDEVNHGLISINQGITESTQINIAPRMRMTVLYAVAQSLGAGWRVIGTTNKSEEYIGWLTKWGDGGVDFEPIIDFTVTELRVLGKKLGLPVDLVDKTPVDGLTSYSDEDRFGFTYEQLDNYIVYGTSGNEEIDAKIEKMHEYSEHKRKATPSFKLKL